MTPDVIRPPGRVILRTASGDDAAGVADLLAEAYEEHATAFPPAIWAAYQRELDAVGPRIAESDVIIAEAKGALVGTVTLYTDAAEGVAVLRLLAVPPVARGSGVGRLLVEECRKRATASGCTDLELHTAHFMRAAVLLYERLGFVRMPERDFDAHQRYGDGLVSPDAEPFCGLAYRLRLDTASRG